MLNQTPGDLVALGFAVAAVGSSSLGGVRVRGSAGPVRDQLLEQLSGLWLDGPTRTIPVTVSDERLLGGLDLPATLHAGRPVYQPGILTGCDGALVMLRMAERQGAVVLSTLSSVIDRGRLVSERDGATTDHVCRISLIALDESNDDEPGLAPGVGDRLGIWLDLHPLGLRDIGGSTWTRKQIAAARSGWSSVDISERQIRTLCECAEALGAGSIRSALYAGRVARIAAALRDAERVTEADLQVALALVIAPRASQLPDAPGEASEASTGAADADNESRSVEKPDRIENPLAEIGQTEAAPLSSGAMDDVLLASAVASIPDGVLERLQSTSAASGRANQSGAGKPRFSHLRGRPVGETPGMPGSGKRLAVLGTLRAAIPWQAIRRQESRDAAPTDKRIRVRKSDFRLVRYREPARATTIFVVDASGSSALHRMAEAKGAVEKLLADCYVRRDEVALIMFRGERAEVLLPPTRSLNRAKRALLGLPGGGGTPLACALEQSLVLCEQVLRSGSTPSVVFLTDGKANIDRQGKPGRDRALEDALGIAGRFAQLRIQSIVIDTSARPHPNAERLAGQLNGHYLPMPLANADALDQSVRSLLT